MNSGESKEQTFIITKYEWHLVGDKIRELYTIE